MLCPLYLYNSSQPVFSSGRCCWIRGLGDVPWEQGNTNRVLSVFERFRNSTCMPLVPLGLEIHLHSVLFSYLSINIGVWIFLSSIQYKDRPFWFKIVFFLFTWFILLYTIQVIEPIIKFRSNLKKSTCICGQVPVCLAARQPPDSAVRNLQGVKRV